MNKLFFTCMFAATMHTTATAQNTDEVDVSGEYAKTYRISVEEAKKRLAMLSEINRVDKELEKKFPNQFGGLFVQHEPQFKVVVKMTGAGQGLLNQVTNDPTFVVEKAVTPIQQLNQLKVRVGKRLMDVADYPFAVEVNVWDGTVDLKVPDIEKALNSLPNDLRSNKVLRLIKDSVVSTNTATIYGGRMITGKTLQCTTGFNVTLSTGLQGLVTAGHCDDEGTIAGVSFNLVSESYKNSTEWGADMQIMRPVSGTHTFPNQIYNHSNTIMTVNQVYYASNLPLDWPVCVYGSTTNFKKCGKVKAKWLVLRDNNGITNSVFRVASDDGTAMNTGGDSGGPVFGSGAAYGLIKAKGGATNASDLYFVDIQTLESIMGPAYNPRVKIAP